MGGRDDHQAPASVITCWGDGRLHLRRAADRVIRKVIEPLIGNAAAARLIADLRDEPDSTLAERFAKLQLERRDLQKLYDSVTDQSACHSLWIVIDPHEKPRYHLAIRESAATTKGRTSTLSSSGKTHLFEW